MRNGNVAFIQMEKTNFVFNISYGDYILEMCKPLSNNHKTNEKNTSKSKREFHILTHVEIDISIKYATSFTY